SPGLGQAAAVRSGRARSSRCPYRPDLVFPIRFVDYAISQRTGSPFMDLNDTTDYQRCFACGQRNPYGIHMVFSQEDNTIVSDFSPGEEYQGFPGMLHGGIVAVVLDEALNRTSLLAAHPAWTTTGRLDIRYRRYVPYGPLLRVRAMLGMQRGRMVQASG